MTAMRLAAVVLVSGCTFATQDTGTDAAGSGGTVTSPDAGTATPPGGTRDLSGYGDTAFSTGPDPSNPFFAALGTNDRACATCHDATTGWSMSPSSLQARFDQTTGLDPIFRAVDGATSPTADTSTVAARQTAYHLLVTRGLIRVGRPLPATAEFTLTTVADPYSYASAAELSLFRRPLPSTNLRFAPTLMWDGREATLSSQAIDATLGHAQAMAAPTDQIAAIVAFESNLYTAQTYDDGAGDLAAAGAKGGAAPLVSQTYTPGATGGFDLYTAWATGNPQPGATPAAARRASIARGQRLFDTRRFQIRGVAGIPDQQGTCSTCHDSPNIGAHSTPLLVDLGISDASRRSPDLPLYTFTNTADGTTRQSSDPGLALTTGHWADLGKFKVPTLRAVVMRPPYFHDGFAPDLAAVVGFYDQRFGIGLAPNDRQDLVAFLEAL